MLIVIACYTANLTAQRVLSGEEYQDCAEEICLQHANIGVNNKSRMTQQLLRNANYKQIVPVNGTLTGGIDALWAGNITALYGDTPFLQHLATKHWSVQTHTLEPQT